ncbi:hypothetical protein [Paenibacillus sp. BT-177]|uniref:hypothetical protein n=1 Tax=Paenibacillus sp. BT-177 TaxID=2986930 RepID=UPI0021F6BD82|nr:hypothetical protein [Paenibacillus sp. BT-177]
MNRTEVQDEAIAILIACLVALPTVHKEMANIRRTAHEQTTANLCGGDFSWPAS